MTLSTGCTLEVRECSGDYRPATPEEILAAAQRVINRRFRRGACISSVAASVEFFRHKLALREQEVFAVLFLDCKHHILGYEDVFYGTIDGASIHPRIVVQKALGYNAAAVIVAHNHPSGAAEPSSADRTITLRLKEALSLVDVRLLDHIIVGEPCVSLAESGVI